MREKLLTLITSKNKNDVLLGLKLADDLDINLYKYFKEELKTKLLIQYTNEIIVGDLCTVKFHPYVFNLSIKAKNEELKRLLRDMSNVMFFIANDKNTDRKILEVLNKYWGVEKFSDEGKVNHYFTHMFSLLGRPNSDYILTDNINE